VSERYWIGAAALSRIQSSGKLTGVAGGENAGGGGALGAV
jgi:hypothetical protein